MLESVIAAGKEHFACDAFDRAELENQSGEGTRFSHWERKVFGNELMTSDDLPH